VSSMALRWIQPDWPAPAHVCALTTERSAERPADPHDGFNFSDDVQDAPANVEANRKTLKETLGLVHPPGWLSQQHGTTILNLDDPCAKSAADGSFTTRDHKVCAVLSADCAPVFLSDRQGSFVALLHVGWRGLAGGVLEAGIATVPSAPRETICWVGPAISQDYFEIGEEVRDQLIGSDLADQAHIAPRGERFLADLPGLILARLKRIGVAYAAASRQCTFADPGRWFSYRRQSQCGRMASLIWMAR